jgi:hypothetical protein
MHARFAAFLDDMKQRGSRVRLVDPSVDEVSSILREDETERPDRIAELESLAEGEETPVALRTAVLYALYRGTGESRWKDRLKGFMTSLIQDSLDQGRLDIYRNSIWTDFAIAEWDAVEQRFIFYLDVAKTHGRDLATKANLLYIGAHSGGLSRLAVEYPSAYFDALQIIRAAFLSDSVSTPMRSLVGQVLRGIAMPAYVAYTAVIMADSASSMSDFGSDLSDWWGVEVLRRKLRPNPNLDIQLPAGSNWMDWRRWGEANRNTIDLWMEADFATLRANPELLQAELRRWER